MNLFDALVFDFDGVLADSVSVKTLAFEKMYLKYGREIADKVVEYHLENGGMPRAEKFAFYQSQLLGEDTSKEMIVKLGNEFSGYVVDDVVAAPEIRGARAFLESMHGRIPMFVDSASPDVELVSIIERRELSDFFEGVYGADRSKVENLATILAEHGFSPDKVCFFGDAMSDYNAARECGTCFIGVGPSESPLGGASPTPAMFNDFVEIAEYFERNE